MAAEKQEERAAAAMTGRAPAREKSSFAVTCGLLSQYLKEKKGGLKGLGGLGMAPAAAGKAAARLTALMSHDLFVSCKPLRSAPKPELAS